MRFNQRHRWLWLTLTVVMVLLAHLAVAQLTLAHENREGGRERPRQTALISVRDEDGDEEFEDAEDDEHVEDDADKDEDRDEADDDMDEVTSVAPVQSTPANPVQSPAPATPTPATPAPATPTPATPAPAPAPARQVAVNIVDSQFQPSTVTVAVGGTVTWTNSDTTPHTATSQTDVFDSGMLRQGGIFSRVFDQAGTFTYVCSFHNQMRGTIIVTP